MQKRQTASLAIRASLAGVFGLLIGVSVLAGWALNVPTLKSVVPGWSKMSALTAFCFCLTGISLALAAAANNPESRLGLRGEWPATASRVFACIGASIGFLRLCQYVLGVKLFKDSLIFNDAPDGSSPAQTAVATALDLVLVNCALLLARSRRFIAVFNALALTSAIGGWFGLAQFLYGGEPVLPYVKMAMHTAVTLLVLSAGVLCIRNDGGLIGLLVSETAGAIIARRLIPAVFFLPVLFGFFTLAGERRGWYSREAGASLLAFANMLVFGLLIWANAALLRQSDEQRKLAQEDQRYSEQRFQTLAETIPNLIWTCDANGSCDYLSRQWVIYTGRTAEEQLGFGWADQLHPEDRFVAEAVWAAAVSKGENYDVQFRIRRHDGVYRWFRTRAVPLKSNDGKIIKWIGSNTDVEEYKLSEQRIQRQLERLNLLDEITRAIARRQDVKSIFAVAVSSLEENLSIDLAFVCSYVAGEESLTVACVGPKSRSLGAELEMPEDSKISIGHNALSRCIKGSLVYEPDISGLPFPFSQRLARVGIHSFVVAPMLVESTVFGLLLLARRQADSFTSNECEFIRQLSEHVALATYQAQLNCALQQAYDDLRSTQDAVVEQERLRALGQMTSGIAHDINNAIAPASLFTESLIDSEPGLSDRARNYLSYIRQGIADVAHTVGRMREFYRAPEPNQALSPVDANQIVRQVLDLTRARWFDMPQQSGIVIDAIAELQPDLPKAKGIESEIREALTNLVLNAVDAMPEGGTLRIRTFCGQTPSNAMGIPSRETVTIEVIDTGIGMDEETKKRCMEPFFTSKGKRGTGLGLAMVYGIAQRHGGSMEIESTLGSGTTIGLNFESAREDLDGQQTDFDQKPLGQLRILVIDDDPLIIRSLRDALSYDGHTVISSTSGQDGIEAFRSQQESGEPFTVVITDLGMPHVDGRQVASAIKLVAPKTPIILLTGWGQRLAEDGEKPAGVDLILSKPPRLRDLRAALNSVFANPRENPTVELRQA